MKAHRLDRITRLFACFLAFGVTVKGCADSPTEASYDVPPAMRSFEESSNICREEWTYYPAENRWYREGPGEWWYSDPFEQCPGYYDRGWGNIHGDGLDYVGWTELGEFQGDHHGEISATLVECPLCRLVDVAGRVASNPKVREHADDIGEDILGAAHRLVYEWNRIGPYLYDRLGQFHHIGTDKNWVSSISGGPWTPRFADLFSRVGLSLSDHRNRVYVLSHVGPHSRAYHEAVFNRLNQAASLGRQRFLDELAEIAHECATPGTVLHELCTRQR